ncbi:lysophospholipid acyltransferase family protein [Botrimarina sp.]|uniref:lysophospholipid acyltransferase family protein n=1 Tax=Botrimarina sp. TaxID=2795802 RepID=UPI0032EB0C8F
MRRSRQAPIDYAGYLALRVAVAGVQAAPLWACERAAGGVAWLAHHVLRLRRRVVDENLATAFPAWSAAEREATALAMWRHLFLMVAEIAHAPRKVHRTTWRDWVELEHDDVVLRALLDEGPKVVISAHYGNFEFGGYLLGLFGLPTHTIARTIDNPYVDRFVNEFRGRTGQYILPKDGSREEVERVLSAGGVLTLLGDQYAGRKGCWVDFFGKPASTHKAVSLFTLTYRAPTVVVGVQRLGGAALRYRVSGVDSVDPRSADFQLGATPLMTEWFTRRIEDVIRREPSQYWWVHRRWKGAPGAARRKQPPVAA